MSDTDYDKLTLQGGINRFGTPDSYTEIDPIGGVTSPNLTTTALSATGIKIPLPTTPANAGATGVKGSIVWDTSYIYVCVATNTWKRVAISTWP